MTEWKRLGLNLDINMAKLNEIDVNNRGQVAECKLNMVQFWLESDMYRSWKKLIDALLLIDQKVLAERIRDKYCPQYKG